jgi:hypothetical protein
LAGAAGVYLLDGVGVFFAGFVFVVFIRDLLFE